MQGSGSFAFMDVQSCLNGRATNRPRLLHVQRDHQGMGYSSVWTGSLLRLHRILHATNVSIQHFFCC